MRLGCIADDYTGATDLAGELASAGMRVVQLFGPPGSATAPSSEVDAVVVALKIRNVPASEAVSQAVATARWMQAEVETVMFKYCSTFDSTPAGNIGPVHEALMDYLGERQSISTPANPENGRTVYMGHLFVGDRLLPESGMGDHPLTPMTDASLPRVLGAQTDGEVALLPLNVVHSGADAVRAHLGQLRGRASGRQIVICDAIEESDLDTLASAARGMRLVAGAGGLGAAISRETGCDAGAAPLPAVLARALDGPGAVIAGSCSTATLTQIDTMARSFPTFRFSADDLARSPDLVARIGSWAGQHVPASPVLVAASQPPEEVAAAQRRLGAKRAAQLVEDALATVAAELRARGVRKLIVAGGETSGAVINRLGIRRVRVGPALASGVPWVYAEGSEPLLMALKSGNFGPPTMFVDAAAPASDPHAHRRGSGTRVNT